MDPRSYDYWLFDLDGTLVDVEPDYARSVIARVGDRIEYPFSTSQADVLWFGLGESRDGLLQSWGIDPERFWRVFHEEEDPQARADATFLYDDAAAIGELDRPVGIVTHCQEYLTERVLSHLGITDWFETVVCCSEEIGWKPDPAPVRRAMHNMAVSRNDHAGVFVGDGLPDIGAARNVGLDSVHVERQTPEVRGYCVLSDHRVESFDRLWIRE